VPISLPCTELSGGKVCGGDITLIEGFGKGLTSRLGIASRIRMKARQLCFLLAAMIFPSLQVFADSPVTFEVVATFQGPGSSAAVANVINDLGDVGGWCPLQHSTVGGFIRLHNGHFTDPITEPDGTGATYIGGLNNTGTASGYYETDTGVAGFLYSGGAFTTISVDPVYTYVAKVNDAGNYCGSTLSGAFVSIDGTLTTFSVNRGAAGAEGINNLDQVVGGYYVDGINYGYLRDADGTLHFPYGVPGNWFTTLRDINDAGLMVGTTAGDTGTQGVVFRSPGSYALYTYPGGGATSFTGINNRGLMCGYYLDDKNDAHAFIVRMRPATGE